MSLKELIQKGKDILQFLFKKWFFIIIAGFIGASFGFYNAWNTKPLYSAKLSFTLENESSNPLGNYSGLASIESMNLSESGGNLFSSDNIITFMTSRKMIVNTLLSPIIVGKKKETLIEYWLSFNHINDKWNLDPKLANLKFPLNTNSDSLSREQNGLLKSIHSSLIQKSISIYKPDKKLSLILAICTSSNELFSKVFLENLLIQVTDYYVSIKTKRQKENVDILQNRADSLNRVLSNSIYGNASLSDQNINMAKQVAGVNQQKKQIDLQVVREAYVDVMKNLDIAKITLHKETPLIQVLDQPIFPLEIIEASKKKGLLIGGFLGVFIMIGLLLGIRWVKEMLND